MQHIKASLGLAYQIYAKVVAHMGSIGCSSHSQLWTKLFQQLMGIKLVHMFFFTSIKFHMIKTKTYHLLHDEIIQILYKIS
jgi:hypothetical protein